MEAMEFGEEMLGLYRPEKDKTLIIDRFLEVNTRGIAQVMFAIETSEVEVLWIGFEGAGKEMMQTSVVGTKKWPIKLGGVPTFTECSVVIAYNKELIKARALGHLKVNPDRGQAISNIIIYLWIEIARALRSFVILDRGMRLEELLPPSLYAEFGLEDVLDEELLLYGKYNLSNAELRFRIDTSLISAYSGSLASSKNDRNESLTFEDLARIIRDTTRHNRQNLLPIGEETFPTDAASVRVSKADTLVPKVRGEK